MATYTTYEALASRYAAINEQIKALQDEKSELNEYVKEQMGEDSKLDCGDYYFVKYVANRTTYPVTLVQKIFGAGAVKYLKVDKTLLTKDLEAELKDPNKQKTAGKIVGMLKSAEILEGSTEQLRLVKS